MNQSVIDSRKSILRSLFLSLFSAVLLSLPFSNGKLWLAGWFGFIPLFFALNNKSKLQAFFLAYLCGVVFWLCTVYWLVHVTLLGTIILIFYLALFFGFFGFFLFTLSTQYPVCSLFFIPASWVLLEYLRSYLFTGFPWALLGLGQYKNLMIIQIAAITGVWGVSFLVMLFNVAIFLILAKRQRKKISLICVLILFLSLFYGFCRLNYKPEASDSKECVKVALVQGNIPQDLKWDKQAIGFIQSSYKELTLAAATNSPDLIIWPEASVPGVWGQDDAEFMQVFTLARRLKTNLLVGAVTRLRQDYFNSALFIDQAGEPAMIYSKIHLVPFGEYVPLKNIFPFLQTVTPIGGLEPGKEYVIFSQPANFSVLICFEDLFPELSRAFVKKGAKFLVNITNDAWYKESSAAQQHFAASVFRAVENHVYLARAANTGISGFIDPFGRSSSVVRDAKGKNIFVKGYGSQNICLTANRRTIYNRFGDFFVLFCLLLDACVIILKITSVNKIR